MKTLAICILTLTLIGCGSLPLNGQGASVTVRNDVTGCSYLGPVTGSNRMMSVQSPSKEMQDAINSLRNNAGALGADSVKITSTHTSIDGASVIGNAYRCVK